MHETHFALFSEDSVPKVVDMTNAVVSVSGLELGKLVEVRELGLRLVVGSEWALPLVVSWAHATEMIDPRPHLRGAELVCTVGSALLNPESCARLVVAVKATNSAGICFGIGEVHTQLPHALIEECRRLSVPLIKMDHGVPFLAINDVLADARVRAQVGTNQRDGQLISTLLVTLRENAPIEEILNVSAESLGGWLSYRSGDHAIRSTRGGSGSEPIQGSDETLSITIRDGDLLSWHGQSPKPEADLLGQIGRILEIARREKAAREDQGRQRVGQLFALVADGLADAAALIPELQKAGLSGKLMTVSAWPAETAPLLAAHLPTSLIADAPEATFVVTTGPETVHETARSLGLVCGHGSPVGLTEIGRGITEARATLLLARNQGKVTGPESLTSLTGLLEQQPAVALVPFIDQLIRPLIAHDARRVSQLLPTLRAFIEQRGSLQSTAAAHYLHVNTVRHRLGRIAQITGRNPLEYSDQISLAIALWAYDRSGRKP